MNDGQPLGMPVFLSWKSRFYRRHRWQKVYGVHINTVRLYEELGYIPPVPRAANGYRMFSRQHLEHLKLARIALSRCEFCAGEIRKSTGVSGVGSVYAGGCGKKPVHRSRSLGSIAGMDGDLWLGRFDFTLLKPVPVQFYISIRNWNPWALMNAAAALVLLVVAALKLNSSLKKYTSHPVR